MKHIKKIGILAALIVLVLAIWVVVTPEQAPAWKPGNVLVITVDTLRSDHLGCYGYEHIKTPNIDRLAEQGTMFQNAIAQVPLTLPSHVSLFTSTYPQFNAVRVNGRNRLDVSAVTLAERLQADGHTTAAFVSAFVLDARFGLDQGFAIYDDEMQKETGKRLIAHLEAERTADEVTGAAVEWLKEKKDRNFFLWVHYYDPHDIYNPPSPYREIYKDNPYDGEIAFTDEHIGVLLASLKELELDKNTLIVFVADHAEGFGEHEEFGHSVFVYDTTVKVPLIFACPGLIEAGKVVEEQVRLVDVMPTILDFMQLEKHEAVQGNSLIGLIDGRIDSLDLPAYSESLYARLHYNWSELRSFRTREWKYIQSPDPELYNIRDDPQELVNLARSNIDVVRELDQRLDAFLAATSAPAVKGTSMAMDEETARKLESLGYIGSTATESEGPVPRKQVQIIGKLDLAARQANEGLIDQAVAGFIDVLNSDPSNTTANTHLAKCYAEIGKYDEAIRYFEIADSLGPDDPELINAIGSCYLDTLELDKALARFNRAIELNPEYAEAYSNRGAAYEKSGDYPQAFKDCDKAIELDAEFAEAYSNRAVVHSRSGDYQRSIADLDKAIELDPLYMRAYYNRAIAHQTLGNHQQALKDYDRVIELAPQHMVAYYNQGRAYQTSGNYQQAIQNFNRVVELAPQFAEAYFNRGISYDEIGNDERAIADFANTRTGAPRETEVYARLAKVYEKTEKYEAAIEAWKRVLVIDPQSRNAQENLKRLGGLIRR